jgi:hypothetical protein
MNNMGIFVLLVFDRPVEETCVSAIHTAAQEPALFIFPQGCTQQSLLVASLY